ncbi:MAG: hypothetical protein ABR572_02150 [Cryomorphaceae bacterium]|nr:hypothetical protein [Flavobacteriales bacterium]
MDNKEKIETWPDLAVGLYDKLTGRNAQITYEFEDLTIQVPTKVGSTEMTAWNLSGKMKISTSENK